MNSSYTYWIRSLQNIVGRTWQFEFVKSNDEMFSISICQFSNGECSLIGYYDRYDYFTLSGKVERITESLNEICENLEEAITVVNRFIRLNGKNHRPLVEYEHLMWAEIGKGERVEPGCELQPEYTQDELDKLEDI